jgi:hypothetical protein
MSEGFGGLEGWGNPNDSTGIADTKVAETRRAAQLGLDTGRWPEARTMVRVVLLAIASIVGGGWLLTLVNAGR